VQCQVPTWFVHPSVRPSVPSSIHSTEETIMWQLIS
jgi:hypothetical protein